MRLVFKGKIFWLIMAAIVAAFSFLQSLGLSEVVLSISVVLRECCQGIVRLELLTLITSSWSCWLCMWPLYLSGWRVGGARSTEQPVHMDSGRKRLANGIERRRHFQCLERLTIIWMSAISVHTVLTAERFRSCYNRQAKPFSGLSPGFGSQLPLPNALRCVCTGLFMASL